MLSVHPEQHLRLGQTLFDIEVVALQGDTAITIRRPWEHGMGEPACQFVGAVWSAFRLCQDMDRTRGLTSLLQQPLMGGGVLRLDKGLMDLF